MAKKKKAPRLKIDYSTSAEPKAWADGVPVFCAHDAIEQTADLVPNPKNPNKHPDSQVELLAQIIQAQGWRNPITVSNLSGMVVKGHGRLLAAKLLGKAEVPVDHQNYASEAEEYADLIADNRLSELSEIDNVSIADLLTELDTGEIPIELTGYTDDDLESLINAISGADDTEDDKVDDTPEPPVLTISKRGDLWRVGEHRIICGDSTDPATIDRLMQGEKAQVVNTDPPYGVSYESSSGKFDAIANDDLTQDDLMNKLLIPALRNCVRSAKDDAAFYIWHASSTRRDFDDAMVAVGLIEKQYIIWVKNSPVLGHADYLWAHEPCYYCEKAGHSAKWYGDRKQSTAWKVTIRSKDGMATVLSGGLVVTDGAGNKVFMAEKPPKGKKIRYLRLSDGRSVTIDTEHPTNTVWEVARESNAKHPCLPAGQKVFFNGEWKNIEDVKVGDTNRYGTVVATTIHLAKNLVEISCGDHKTIATWNHPFLVQKEDGIYWVNAENIAPGDKMVDVCRAKSSQPEKGISAEAEKGKPEWNTISYGKCTTGQFQKECRSTIEISTRRTTTFPICNLSRPLNTSGFTLVASNEEMSGTSRVPFAESTKSATAKTGTSAEAGSPEESAKSATLKKLSKTEEGVLRTVGSVKRIEKPTTVYNLTMSGIPAFDTEVGLSHNTQKPVELAVRAIENSSELDDIVLDVFGGSHSTMIGAELTGRKARICELEPKYVDVGLLRYVQLKGLNGTITCERDGKVYGFLELCQHICDENGISIQGLIDGDYAIPEGGE